MPALSTADLREEYRNAVGALHTQADSVDTAVEAFENADDSNREERQSALDEANAEFALRETAANELRDRFELAERTDAARAIAIPEAPESPDVRVTSEPLTYQKHRGTFFRDLYRRDQKGDSAAASRLDAHMAEMRVEQPDKFDLSSTDSAGGYLVAPLYLQDEFATLARAARPTVDALGARSLPPNTDSINIPTLATGVTTAAQTDNNAVSETDATFGTVAADVQTEAGMQDVSQQLIDRSVPGVDEVIFQDLVKAYNARLDLRVLTSTTSNNEGILAADSTNTVSYTDASPTVPEFYSSIANAIQKIHTNLFLPPDAIIMHPRRWGWILAAGDSTGRPLVTPYDPQNAAGVKSGVVSEGFVGSLHSLPVFVDAQVPILDGAGTNEDSVIVLRRDESYVWEDKSGPYLETFRDVGSGTLTVRFRLHNYWAQQHERRPKSITLVTGTGLVAPTF